MGQRFLSLTSDTKVAMVLTGSSLAANFCMAITITGDHNDIVAPITATASGSSHVGEQTKN